VELGTHPYFVDYIFYPEGTSLAFHTLSLFNTLLGVPLQAVFGRLGTYNFLLFLGSVLSGWGAYLLGFYLCRNHWGAWLCSLIFAFSPYRLAHLEHHLNLASTQFIPFFALYLVKLMDTPRVRYAWAAAFFLFLAGICSWYYLVYGVCFALLFLGWQAAGGRLQLGEGQRLRLAVLTFAMAGGLVLPFAYPMLKEWYYGVHYFLRPEELIRLFGGDLAAYFLPQPRQLAARLTLGASSAVFSRIQAPRWEMGLYLGYSVLGLGMYALWRRRKETGFWAVAGVIFGVLSLGPRLKVGGYQPWEADFLPYFWIFQKLPFLRLGSVPARFVVLVYLCLGVLGAYAWAEYAARTSNWRRRLVGVALASVILFEYHPGWFEFTDPARICRTDFLLRELEPGDYALLELPLDGYVANEIYMYRQTQHQKRLLFGTVSRLRQQSLTFIQSSGLGALFGESPGPEDLFLRIKDRLKTANVRYIILNKYLYCRKTTAAILEKRLASVFPQKARLNNEIILFQVY